VEEIVKVSSHLRIVGDFRCDLGANVSHVRHGVRHF
jgi:hypothetical protein